MDAPETLETLVRDVLREHAADAPTDVPSVAARRRRWPYALVAAALVAGLAVALVAVRSGTPTSHPAAIPAGYRAISYHGITVAVPRSLPLDVGSCGAFRNSVEVDDGVLRMCPSAARRRSIDTLVSLSSNTSLPRDRFGGPMVPLTIDGVVGQRYDGSTSGNWAPIPTTTIVITSLHVSLSVTTRDHGLADTVLDSIRITPIDMNGCTERLPTHFDPPALTAPVSASVCEYGRAWDGSTGWLVASGPVDRADLRPVGMLGTSTPDRDYGAIFVGRLHYADGIERVVGLTRGDWLAQFVR